MSKTLFESSEKWIDASPSQLGFENPQLYTKTWSPETTRATVVFIHGIAEHISRYDEMFGTFAMHGIKVTAFDQRGFGKTVLKYGKRGQSEGIDTTLKDILLVSNMTKMDGIPHFAMGHSMGGGLVLRFAMQHPEGLTGVIASAPCIKPGKAGTPNFIEKAGLKMFNKIAPKLIIPNQLSLKTLTRDKQEFEKYNKDELIHPMTGVVLLQDILANCQYLEDNCAKFNLPLLITHGTVDELTSYPASEMFIDVCSSSDKTFRSFSGFYHELHNEPGEDRKQVFQEYIQWITKRIK